MTNHDYRQEWRPGTDLKIKIPPRSMETEEKTPGQRLLFAIKNSDMTQRKFAELIDMSPNGLNMIVKGRNRLNRRLALATELITGVKADWLLTAEGSWM